MQKEQHRALCKHEAWCINPSTLALWNYVILIGYKMFIIFHSLWMYWHVCVEHQEILFLQWECLLDFFVWIVILLPRSFTIRYVKFFFVAKIERTRSAKRIRITSGLHCDNLLYYLKLWVFSSDRLFIPSPKWIDYGLMLGKLVNISIWWDYIEMSSQPLNNTFLIC